jgi:transposase InsO family protein
MSRKGNCWDNAVMERFFLNLKMERVWQRTYANRGEAMTAASTSIPAPHGSPCCVRRVCQQARRGRLIRQGPVFTKPVMK